MSLGFMLRRLMGWGGDTSTLSPSASSVGSAGSRGKRGSHAGSASEGLGHLHMEPPPGGLPPANSKAAKLLGINSNVTTAGANKVVWVAPGASAPRSSGNSTGGATEGSARRGGAEGSAGGSEGLGRSGDRRSRRSSASGSAGASSTGGANSSRGSGGAAAPRSTGGAPGKGGDGQASFSAARAPSSSVSGQQQGGGGGSGSCGEAPTRQTSFGRMSSFKRMVSEPFFGTRAPPSSGRRTAEEEEEAAAAAAAAGGGAGAPSNRLRPFQVVILVTGMGGNAKVEAEQRRFRSLFTAKKLVFQELDGADPANRDKREFLFSLAKSRRYPQVYLESEGNIFKHVGPWEVVQELLDAADVPADILAKCPEIKTFDQVFAGLPKGDPVYHLSNVW